MPLNVGELVAHLTLDDSRFIQGTRNAGQQTDRLESLVQQAARRIEQHFQQSAQGVDRLSTSTSGAQQDMGRLGTAAGNAARDASRVGQSAQDVNRLGNAARGAATDVDRISTSASQASRQVDQLSGDLDGAAAGASNAGGNMGGNFLSGFTDKIGKLSSSTGPIAGALLGVGVIGLSVGAALAAAINDGMQQEANLDLFQARTKTTEAQARKFGLAAGEAYSDAFGESVEANLSTLTLALQSNVIDPGATQQDAEKVIASLDTISTALDGEVSQSVLAVSSLMSTGLAASAQEASDMIANAVGGSANKQGDLLETISEYSAGWKNAGISAEMALALIEQSTDNGADNSDRAGDSLREFGRRITEEGDTIVTALNDIGLNGAEMYEVFKKGGPEADAAFDQAFDKISAIEDPVKRNAAAMALLGDTSGDFIGALSQWDPSKALADFGEFEGAAGKLANQIGGNTATSVKGAMNSISTVADGFKAALAAAFGPQIAEWADNISNNRVGVIDFFQSAGNAAFELGISVLNFVASGLDGLGKFAKSASETGASFLEMGANILSVGESIPGFGAILGIATGGAADKLRDLAKTTREGGASVEGVLTGAASTIREDLIPALGAAQERTNGFLDGMKLSAAFNDQTAKVTKSIGEIGVAVDGSVIKIENWNGAIDRANPLQAEMETRLRGLSGQFRDQIKTGLEAGNTVENLTRQYAGNRDALIQQLTATLGSNEAAVAYLNTLGLTPEFVSTEVRTEGMPDAKSDFDVLRDKVIKVPDSKTIVTSALTKDSIDSLRALEGVKVEVLKDGTVQVHAETEQAEANLQAWLQQGRSMTIWVNAKETHNGYWESKGYTPAEAARISGPVPLSQNADGNIHEPGQATIRNGYGRGIYQWAEAETGWEAFIPGAPSKRGRSEQILAETARRMGFGVVRFDDVSPMADGGVVESFTGIASQHAPGLQLTSSYRDTNDYHGQGKAVDYSNGSGNTDEQLAWANYLADNYQSQLAELIYSDPRFTRNIKDGKIVDPSFYGAATMQQHENHVHAASKEPLGAPSGAGKDAAPAAPDTRTEREKIADTIIAEGKKRGMSDKQIKAAVMASLEETRLENLDYGMDGDNKGILQQRDSWGTAEERMDPSKAAGMFYDELAKLDSANMTEAQMAQAVQRSGTADGSNYADEAAEAEQIIAASNARGNGSQMTVGTTEAGVALATDGQRVFVTNWPGTSSLTSTPSAPTTTSAPAAEATPDDNVIWKGAFRVFENGGIRGLPEQAGIYPDGADLVRFAEPGTGGEGYIPLHPAKRRQSLAVTKKIVNGFGFDLVPFEDGGIHGGLGGFGGYVGEAPGLKVPTTANGRRAAAYNALAFGVGSAFALASGFDADGNFTGQFDTGANSSAQLEKGFGQVTDELAPILEAILLAIKNREPIRASVNVDNGTGMANISIMKGGL
ncbi:phage tail tape measure protein [Rhodococcus sp. GOMB7]|uniref:phage tail tape measure protein n=2 Tax=Rhodococcus sp. GOMB7 TaxID=2839033 RepID=UPI001C005664|nr:phage tail tape measure protein [Rhodococcus sp. GOMB7]MBT9293658.1 phage tail tape measure protein [Rhodococcus sp. GOMB7]